MILSHCRRAWRVLEEALLAVMMAVMVVVSAAQIALRNLFAYSLPWAEPLVQVLLLWVTMVGAMVATRQGRHLRIDLVLRWAPAGWRGGLERTAAGLAGAICGLLASVGSAFVKGEAAAGTTGVFGLPTWHFQLVFPLCFGVMCLRFAGLALHRPDPGGPASP